MHSCTVSQSTMAQPASAAVQLPSCWRLSQQQPAAPNSESFQSSTNWFDTQQLQTQGQGTGESNLSSLGLQQSNSQQFAHSSNDFQNLNISQHDNQSLPNQSPISNFGDLSSHSKGQLIVAETPISIQEATLGGLEGREAKIIKQALIDNSPTSESSFVSGRADLTSSSCFLSFSSESKDNSTTAHPFELASQSTPVNAFEKEFDEGLNKSAVVFAAMSAERPNESQIGSCLTSLGEAQLSPDMVSDSYAVSSQSTDSCSFPQNIGRWTRDKVSQVNEISGDQNSSIGSSENSLLIDSLEEMEIMNGKQEQMKPGDINISSNFEKSDSRFDLEKISSVKESERIYITDSESDYADNAIKQLQPDKQVEELARSSSFVEIDRRGENVKKGEYLVAIDIPGNVSFDERKAEGQDIFFDDERSPNDNAHKTKGNDQTEDAQSTPRSDKLRILDRNNDDKEHGDDNDDDRGSGSGVNGDKGDDDDDDDYGVISEGLNCNFDNYAVSEEVTAHGVTDEAITGSIINDADEVATKDDEISLADVVTDEVATKDDEISLADVATDVVATKDDEISLADVATDEVATKDDDISLDEVATDEVATKEDQISTDEVATTEDQNATDKVATKEDEVDTKEDQISTDDVATKEDQIATDENTIDQVAIDEVATDEITPDEVANNEFATDEVVTNDVATDEVATDEVATDEGATNELTTDEVAASEVNTDDGFTNEVSTDEIATGEVATDEGSTNELTTDEIATGEVATDEGSTNEVTTDEIATGEVATDEGSTNEVTTDEIATSEVKTDGGSTNEVTTDEIATSEVNTDGGSTNNEDAANEGSINEVVTDEVATNGGATNEVATNEVFTDEVSTDEVSTDGLAIDEADIDEATTDEVATNDAVVDGDDCGPSSFDARASENGGTGVDGDYSGDSDADVDGDHSGDSDAGVDGDVSGDSDAGVDIDTDVDGGHSGDSDAGVDIDADLDGFNGDANGDSNTGVNGDAFNVACDRDGGECGNAGDSETDEKGERNVDESQHRIGSMANDRKGEKQSEGGHQVTIHPTVSYKDFQLPENSPTKFIKECNYDNDGQSASNQSGSIELSDGDDDHFPIEDDENQAKRFRNRIDRISLQRRSGVSLPDEQTNCQNLERSDLELNEYSPRPSEEAVDYSLPASYGKEDDSQSFKANSLTSGIHKQGNKCQFSKELCPKATERECTEDRNCLNGEGKGATDIYKCMKNNGQIELSQISEAETHATEDLTGISGDKYSPASTLNRRFNTDNDSERNAENHQLGKSKYLTKPYVQGDEIYSKITQKVPNGDLANGLVVACSKKRSLVDNCLHQRDPLGNKRLNNIDKDSSSDREIPGDQSKLHHEADKTQNAVVDEEKLSATKLTKVSATESRKAVNFSEKPKNMKDDAEKNASHLKVRRTVCPPPLKKRSLSSQFPTAVCQKLAQLEERPRSNPDSTTKQQVSSAMEDSAKKSAAVREFGHLIAKTIVFCRKMVTSPAARKELTKLQYTNEAKKCDPANRPNSAHCSGVVSSVHSDSSPLSNHKYKDNGTSKTHFITNSEVPVRNTNATQNKNVLNNPCEVQRRYSDERLTNSELSLLLQQESSLGRQYPLSHHYAKDKQDSQTLVMTDNSSNRSQCLHTEGFISQQSEKAHLLAHQMFNDRPVTSIVKEPVQNRKKATRLENIPINPVPVCSGNVLMPGIKHSPTTHHGALEKRKTIPVNPEVPFDPVDAAFRSAVIGTPVRSRAFKPPPPPLPVPPPAHLRLQTIQHSIKVHQPIKAHQPMQSIAPSSYQNNDPILLKSSPSGIEQHLTNRNTRTLPGPRLSDMGQRSKDCMAYGQQGFVPYSDLHRSEDMATYSTTPGSIEQHHVRRHQPIPPHSIVHTLAKKHGSGSTASIFMPQAWCDSYAEPLGWNSQSAFGFLNNQHPSSSHSHLNSGPLNSHFTNSINPHSKEAAVPNQCSECKTEASFLCSGCRAVWYCSAVCQNRAWRLHKEYCTSPYPSKGSFPTSPLV